MPKTYKDRSHDVRRNNGNGGGDKHHLNLDARIESHAKAQKSSSRPITGPGSGKTHPKH